MIIKFRKMFVNFKYNLHILFFSLYFISNIQSTASNIDLFKNKNKIPDKFSFQKGLNNSDNIECFASNENNNAFSNWIKDNLAIFCVIISIIVIAIVAIIILIVCCVRYNKRYKELKMQVSKISFESSDVRESRQNEDSDQLI